MKKFFGQPEVEYFATDITNKCPRFTRGILVLDVKVLMFFTINGILIFMHLHH